MEFLKLAVLLFMMVFVTAVFHPAALGMLYRSTWRAMRWGLRICAAAFLIGYCLATPALAAAAASSTLLNIPPDLLSELNALIIGTIVAVLTLLFKWVMSHVKLQNAQAQQLATDAFQNLLDKGAKFGATQLQAAEKNVGTIDVGNAGVAAGANFVIAHGPDLAKKVGVDVTTDDGRAAIVRSVTLRLGQVMANGAPPSIPLPASVTPPSQ